MDLEQFLRSDEALIIRWRHEKMPLKFTEEIGIWANRFGVTRKELYERMGLKPIEYIEGIGNIADFLGRSRMDLNRFRKGETTLGIENADQARAEFNDMVQPFKYNDKKYKVDIESLEKWAYKYKKRDIVESLCTFYWDCFLCIYKPTRYFINECRKAAAAKDYDKIVDLMLRRDKKYKKQYGYMYDFLRKFAEEEVDVTIIEGM